MELFYDSRHHGCILPGHEHLQHRIGQLSGINKPHLRPGHLDANRGGDGRDEPSGFHLLDLHDWRGTDELSLPDVHRRHEPDDDADQIRHTAVPAEHDIRHRMDGRL